MILTKRAYYVRIMCVQDYQELRRRLDQVAKPSTIKTWGQTAGDVAVALKNGSVTVLRFLG